MRRWGYIVPVAPGLHIRPDSDIPVGPEVGNRAAGHMALDHIRVLSRVRARGYPEVLHNQVAVLVVAGSLLRKAVARRRAVAAGTAPAFLLEVGHMLPGVGRMAGHLREPDNLLAQKLPGDWLFSYLRLCCHTSCGVNIMDAIPYSKELTLLSILPRSNLVYQRCFVNSTPFFLNSIDSSSKSVIISIVC